MHNIRMVKPRRLDAAGLGHNVLSAIIAISLVAGTGAWQVLHSSAAIALYSTTYDSQVHNRINVYRTNRDLRALTVSSCLMTYARASAARMARNNSMTHATNLTEARIKCGNGSAIGENIAAGYTDPVKLCSAWFNSTSHRANMLKASYRYGAVASYKSGTGRVYTASWFLAP